MDFTGKLNSLLGETGEPEVQHELLLRQVGNEWVADVHGQKISPRAIMAAVQAVGQDRLRFESGEHGFTISESWMATDGSENVVDFYHVRDGKIEPLKGKKGLDGLSALYRWQKLRQLQGFNDGQDYSNSQRLADMTANPADFFAWVKKSVGIESPRAGQGLKM